MKKVVNWGIIGPGKIANKFARDIQVVENAQLHAVASRSLEKAQQFAEAFHAPHAFGSYEDLFACPDLDAIYIATPHVFHYEHTLLCLEAGFPVLCEKPFAMNTEQVNTMIATAKDQNLFLMEALWTRFLPTMAKVQELIENGTIGQLQSIRVDFGFQAPFLPEKRLFNKDLGGGALLDIGIYPVFLALFLMGQPDELLASAHIGKTGVDEEIGMIFNYENGQMAHLHSTLRAKTKTEAFIYGDKGTIHLRERWFTPTSMSLSLYEEESKNRTIEFIYEGTGFEYEIEAASCCILEGRKESKKMPLSFSLELIQLLDRIRKQIGLSYSV